MYFRSIPRFLSSQIPFPNPKFWTARFAGTSVADKIYDHLKKNGGNTSQGQIGLVMCKRRLIQMPSSNLKWFSGFSYGLLSNQIIGILLACMAKLVNCFRAETCFMSVKTFKVVLDLCKEANLADEALWVSRKMPEFDLCPDTTMFNSVIRLFCLKGDMHTAESLMKEMGLVDLYPDMITYVEMVKGFCNVGRLGDASGLFKAVKEQGCEPNTVFCSVLVDGLCKNGDMDRALGSV